MTPYLLLVPKCLVRPLGITREMEREGDPAITQTVQLAR